jgi:glycerol kinase
MAYQTRDVLDAMREDSGVTIQSLRVDGGATANNWLMQFQSDVLGVNVSRPMVQETTALGAAYLAGLATGVWRDTSDIVANWQLQREFVPSMSAANRSTLIATWHRAIERSRGWAQRCE